MPPYNTISSPNKCVKSEIDSNSCECQTFNNNNNDNSFPIKSSNESVCEFSSNSVVIKSYPNKNVRYIYNTSGKSWIVWPNVYLFIVLHLIYFYCYYLCFINKCWYTWIFGFWYGLAGGLGVTAGAHRLWSHRSYKAKLPLRIFLCICHTIAGQNDLFEWCRDHRVHHKFSETDADPHNSNNGFFFAHIGWLMMRKHPDVIIKGKHVDCSDLLRDPVIRIQKKYYLILYPLLCFIVPTLIPIYFWSETWFNSFLLSGLWRYCTSLHCTWFVNSAAHMFGDKPELPLPFHSEIKNSITVPLPQKSYFFTPLPYRYRSKYQIPLPFYGNGAKFSITNPEIEPRENKFVSFGAFGEGFHNYHHTFPWDYSTSEMGWKWNITTFFIDFMAYTGQAYDLKRLSRENIKTRKLKVSLAAAVHN